jgi:hypothetical protein
MPTDMQLLTKTLKEMKDTYENAIRQGRYTELIRSQRLIGMLHKFVATELRKRFPPRWIYMDKPVYGYPKVKSQDILIQSPQDSREDVTLGPIATINVRSQLSSIDKNYDTLFERLFAEALNLHNRFPYLVLGYLYLLPKIGYDEQAAKKKQVELVERYNVEKYILSFLSITNRESPNDDLWKYERVALLIVDFQKDPPVVIDNLKTLSEEGLVNEKFASFFSFEPLSIQNFFDDIYRITLSRNYLLLGKKL